MDNATNAVVDLGTGIADSLGHALSDGLFTAQSVLENNEAISEAQGSIASILLMFVGIAALFYVGRWLYKAFKRGAA